MSDQLVSLEEMAALLKIHPETLRGYAHEDKVPYYKLPAEDDRGKLRFNPTDVLAALRKEK